MADQQVGNPMGVQAVGNDNLNEQDTKLSDITANGVNTVTVDNLENIEVGMSIDIVTKADGTVVAGNRTVTNLTDAGVLTYSGADAATTTAEAVYPVDGYVNGSQTGFYDTDLNSIASMRGRLAEIDAGYYTDEKLNQMTYNDLVYAIRVNDHPATIK